MEIPLNAQVQCSDGDCGRAAYVLVNPVIDQITHLVVKEGSSSDTEYIVPVDYVTDTIADTIQLNCSKAELENMDPFIQTEFIEEEVPERALGYNGMYSVGSYYYQPYVTPGTKVKIPVETHQIPPGELAVQRGTRVEAADGYVGKVDEFVINPDNGSITHLVMREGHLWGKKDVIIPISAIGETSENTVFLKLDKQQIESLPNFPLQRHWS
jgi:sporulation protein YlmC with PRC-barrel domain